MKKKILYFSLFMLLSLASCSTVLPSDSSQTPNVNPNQPAESTPPTGEPSTPDTGSSTTPTVPPSTGGEGSSSSPAEPSETPLDLSVNNILEPTLSTTSTLKLVNNTNNALIESQTSTVDYDANNLQVSRTVGTSKELTFHKKDGNGAIRVYLDSATNQPAESKLSSATAWNDFGWIASLFTHSDFTKGEGEDVYTYSGASAAEIVKSLSRIDLAELPYASTISSLTLTTSADGTKVEKLNLVTQPFTAGEQQARYEMEIVIEATPRSIVPPSAYTNTDGDGGLGIGSKFGYISNGSTAFKTEAVNPISGDKVVTIVNNGIIYLEKTSGQTVVQNGWYLASKGWVSFNIANNQATLDANTITAPSNFKYGEKLGFNLSYLAFGTDASTGEIVPAPYLANIGANLPYKAADPSTIVDSSVRFKTANDRINEISYDVSSQGQSGKETVTFNYDAAAAVAPQNVLDLLSSKEAEVLPTHTAWKDETGVYGKLTSIYGSTVADSIPYLYKKEIAGKWQEYPGLDGVLVAKGLDKTAFQTEYPALLVKNGYTLQSGTTNLYVNKSVSVEINTRDTSGLATDVSSLHFKKVPTTWKEESADVYNALNDLFKNTTIVDGLPYVYISSLSGQWKLLPLGDKVIVSTTNAQYTSANFVNSYSTALKSAGYTQEGTTNKYTNTQTGVVVEISSNNGVHGLTFLKYESSLPAATTWKEESESLYNQLVSYYDGDSASVDGLPYLYVGGSRGNWSVSTQPNSALLLKPAAVSGGYDQTKFLSDYSALLLKAGYTAQGAQGVYVKGKVKVTVSLSSVAIALEKYEGTTTPPAALPKTWKEENANIHAELVKVYGNETAASSIPYLSNQSTAKKWTMTAGADSQMGVIVQYKGADYATIASDYAQLLIRNSFTKGANNVYTKETTTIQLVSDTANGAVNVAFKKVTSGGGTTTPPAVLPKTWKEENANIHAELVKVYGSDAIATTVPYLSKDTTAKKWTMTNDTSSGSGVIVQYKGADYAAVATEYIELLTTNDFTPGMDNKYTKGTMSIQVAQNSQNGVVNIAFTKVSSGGGETTPPTPPSSNLPKSWQEDNPEIFKELQTIWGSNASTIPYLGRDGVSKNWKVTMTASESLNMAVRIEVNADETLAREFYSDYGKYIIENAGYQARDYGQGYYKGNIQIQFNVDVNGNILINGKIVVTFQNIGG